jgi:glycosyltransferase involved in cell wall biosynthesis
MGAESSREARMSRGPAPLIQEDSGHGLIPEPLVSRSRDFPQKNVKTPSLAILADHPVQHFCPLYKELALQDAIKTTVVFGELAGATTYFDKDFGKTISWGDGILKSFPYVNLEVPAGARFREVWRRVASTLANLQPDVVFVYGYSELICRAGIAWAKLNGKRLVMTGDSELLHRRSLLTRAAKKVVLPPLFRQCDIFLTVGDANERYYLAYGAPPSKFVRTCFPIDSPIYDVALRNSENIRRSIRSRLGVGRSATLILAVGKLIPRKGFDDLIVAFSRALGGSASRDQYLLIAGDGPERARLESLAAGTSSKVRFLGFVPCTDLPEFYVASDLYAHPSHADPHPLAISEAIYCGLPVIASDRVGSIGPTDDVVPGVNGWSYPCGEVESLARLLADVTKHPETLRLAGKASFEMGAKHRPSTVASVVTETVLNLARQVEC